eukprot:TRINITY_DN28261_c0_g1_i3.p1 TRINITY_DN28261_c0_g1~~TRINITY_DN28261_c0_g1_i3.p1  ORF type:complete len:581 (+),score=108.92 TRINITY_DN28261_c0_g1_i3:78-1820(+)
MYLGLILMRPHVGYFHLFFFFFFKQKTAYEMLRSLVGSEMCIRDSPWRGTTLSIRCLHKYSGLSGTHELCDSDNRSEMHDQHRYASRMLELHAQACSMYDKSSWWAESMLERWGNRASDQAHYFSKGVIADDSELMAFCFAPAEELALPIQQRAERLAAGIGHSDSAPQMVDLLLHNVTTFSSFGVAHLFQSFPQMFEQCVYWPLLGGVAKASAWGYRETVEESPKAGYVLMLMALVHIPQLLGKFRLLTVCSDAGIQELLRTRKHKVEVGTGSDARSRSSASGSRRPVDHRDREGADLSEALAIIACNLQLIEESVDSFVGATDEVIATLKERFPDNQHAGEMDKHLSDGPEELGSFKRPGLLSLRETVDRCSWFLMSTIARNIVYGNKLSRQPANMALWDPTLKLKHPDGYVRLLDLVGPHLQRAIWFYSDRLGPHSQGSQMLLQCVQAVMTSGIREMVCNARLSYDEALAIVLDEICPDDPADMTDDHLGRLLEAVLKGPTGRPLLPCHSNGKMDWAVSVKLGNDCSSTCFNCQCIQELCRDLPSWEDFLDWISTVPQRDRGPVSYTHLTLPTKRIV